jgi:hypothetical protein
MSKARFIWFVGGSPNHKAFRKMVVLVVVITKLCMTHYMLKVA